MNKSDIALELARKICKLIDSHTEWSSPETEIAVLLRPHVRDWIPVGERLPEPNVPVLILTTPSQHRYVAEFNETFQEWIDPDKSVVDLRLRKAEVTHWAALPSAPLSLESKGETK